MGDLALLLQTYGGWGVAAFALTWLVVKDRRVNELQEARVADAKGVTSFVIGVVEKQSTLLERTQAANQEVQRALESNARD